MDTPSKQRLITAVRDWTHFDTLYENHAAQAANARTLRAKAEQDAIQLMKEMHLDRSTIQVSGASLTLQRRNVPASLTWGYLEKEIATWSQTPQAKTHPESFLKWLQEHRDHKEVEHLRKTKA